MCASKGSNKTYVFRQSVSLSYPRMCFAGRGAPFVSASDKRIEFVVVLIYWLNLKENERRREKRKAQIEFHSADARVKSSRLRLWHVKGDREIEIEFTFFPHTFVLYFRRHLARAFSLPSEINNLVVSDLQKLQINNERIRALCVQHTKYNARLLLSRDWQRKHAENVMVRLDV